MRGYRETEDDHAGIARLQAARIDVILMDPQYAPRILKHLPLHKAIVDTIREVGNDLKVAVFRRFAVMRHWVTSGQYRTEDIISYDQLHMNDTSYNCIAPPPQAERAGLRPRPLATPLPQTDVPSTADSESHAGMTRVRWAVHGASIKPFTRLPAVRRSGDRTLYAGPPGGGDRNASCHGAQECTVP